MRIREGERTIREIHDRQHPKQHRDQCPHTYTHLALIQHPRNPIHTRKQQEHRHEKGHPRHKHSLFPKPPHNLPKEQAFKNPTKCSVKAHESANNGWGEPKPAEIDGSMEEEREESADTDVEEREGDVVRDRDYDGEG